MSLLYAQLSHALSLNDVCDGLQLFKTPLRGLRGATPPSRNALSHANKIRDCEMAEALFWQVLKHLAATYPGFARGRTRGLAVALPSRDPCGGCHGDPIGGLVSGLGRAQSPEGRGQVPCAAVAAQPVAGVRRRGIGAGGGTGEGASAVCRAAHRRDRALRQGLPPAHVLLGTDPTRGVFRHPPQGGSVAAGGAATAAMRGPARAGRRGGPHGRAVQSGGLPRPFAPGHGAGVRRRPGARDGFCHQQLYLERSQYRRTVPLPLADRSVLQADQADPATGRLPWAQCQRGAVAGLDGAAGVCAAAASRPGAAHGRTASPDCSPCCGRPCGYVGIWPSCCVAMGQPRGTSPYSNRPFRAICPVLPPSLWDSLRASPRPKASRPAKNPASASSHPRLCLPRQNASRLALSPSCGTAVVADRRHPFAAGRRPALPLPLVGERQTLLPVVTGSFVRGIPGPDGG